MKNSTHPRTINKQSIKLHTQQHKIEIQICKQLTHTHNIHILNSSLDDTDDDENDDTSGGSRCKA